ncbi:MAG: PilZ domain-containing protein [Myxococcota bacterium]
MSNLDKRTSRRYHVAIESTLVRDDESMPALIINLSLGGALAQGAFDTPLKIGECVDVSFVIPDLVRPLTVAAEIRWVSQAAPGSSCTIGLEFVTGFPTEQTWALGRFLERQQQA